MMRYIATVAVASSTASGVLETWIPVSFYQLDLYLAAERDVPRAVAAAMLIWSYPAPLWQMNLTEAGSAAMSSASNTPIVSALPLCL